MADEVITAPVTAPVEAAPVAAPVESPVVESAPVVAPVETAAPVVEPVVAPVEAPVEAKPLLATEEPKTEEVKTDAVETPKVESEPVVLPTYEFTLPEDAKADNPVFKSFNEKLGQLQNLGKVDHAAMQKFGQEMIDIHVNNTKEIAESINKSSWDWFNNRNKEWLESAKKDPSIGGDNWDSTLNSAQSAISLYGGNKAQQIEVAKMFQETGVENHPALLRFLSNITRTAAKEGTPIVSQSASVQPKQGIAQALYGNSPKSA